MRVAFYGGSFNPPHIGHALVAAWLRWTDRADAVWIVPVGTHAFGKGLAPFARRRLWCERLVQSLGPWARVEPIEAELPPPSYTLRTLEALAERHADARFRVVVGADALPDLPRWHRWEELEQRFDPLVVGRVGYDSPPDVPAFPGISSTDVRARLLQGRAVDGLVPAAVLDAITPQDLTHWRD